MTSIVATTGGPSHGAARTALVLAEEGLVVRPIRRRDRLAVRLRSGSLDAELGIGLPPEHRWLRAVRAVQLVTPGYRAAIACSWGRVLNRAAAGPPSRTSVAPPIRQAQVRASGDLIGELIEALLGSAPVSAHGVASAQSLLTDGTGPLYSRRSDGDLATAVAAALRQLWLGLGEPDERR